MSLRPKKKKGMPRMAGLHKQHPKSYPKDNRLKLTLWPGEELVERYNGHGYLEYKTKDGKDSYDITIALIRTSSKQRPYKITILNPRGPNTHPEVREYSGIMSAFQDYEEAVRRASKRTLAHLRKSTPFDTTINPEM